MARKIRGVLLIFLSVAVTAGCFIFIKDANIPILDPKGTVASEQKDLLITVTLLMLIVVIPVFVLTFAFAWKYRASNTKAKYSPELDGNKTAEIVWWTIPLLIILVIGGLTWRSSHDLDPFKPINASTKAMKIQVVSLQWKWLFIYPEDNVATVNHVHIPENTPIDFEITSDAPMNSFWIPQLGGQVYAMAGMSTHLNVMANTTGTFDGTSANLSGDGFADMGFKVISSSSTDYKKWIDESKKSPKALSESEYQNLAKPDTSDQVTYALHAPTLYNNIQSKYMGHGTEVKNVDRSDSYKNQEESHHH